MSTFQPQTNKDEKLRLLSANVDEISPVHIMSVEMFQLLIHHLDDLQELVSECSDNLSKTKFYQLLPDIIRKKVTFKHLENKDNVEGQLISIKQLKSLASSMKNGRRRVLFTADESTAINLHLNYLEYILELKRYFDDRIFAFILKITSQWQTTIKKSKMADRNLKCFEDEFTKINGCSQTTQEKMKKPKIVQNKAKCLGEEFRELSSCILTENEVKECADSLDQIKGIKSRWRDLIDCSELTLSFFEEETKDDIMAKNEESQFKLICYVIPDQLIKIEKCAQLSRKWLEAVLSKCKNQNYSPDPDSPANFPPQIITPCGSVVMGQHPPVRLITKDQFSSSARRTRVGPHLKPVLCRISPRREVNKSHTYIGVDRQRKIIETWKKILSADESILVDEKRARRLRTELKRLANKESRYAILENNYETTAGKLEQVCTDYRNALQERHSLNRKIWEEPGFSEEVRTISELYKIGDRIEASQKDMKMLEYSFALLQEDMALEASMRSSYVRFEENVKEMLSKLETKIEEKKQKRKRLDKDMILLKANSKLLESRYKELQEPMDEEEAEEQEKNMNNDEYNFEQIDISVEGETAPEKPQLRSVICMNRKTDDIALSCNSVPLVDSDSPISSDSECTGLGNAIGGVYSPLNDQITSPIYTPFSTRDVRNRQCGSTLRIDHTFDELPFISIDIGTESDGICGDQKFAETKENGRVSRIPILRNSSDFQRRSRNTMHSSSKLKLPNHKVIGSINQQKSRIPKPIY